MARSELGTVTMVTGGRTAERDGGAAGRVIDRRRGLPGSRATVGALLMAVAAVGVFVAYTDATAAPTGQVVVADEAIRAGEELTAGQLRLVRAELPDGTSGTTFSAVEDVLGHVTLSPIGEGEIVQASSVTQDARTGALHEVALTLPRAQVAVGRLRSGERVDVFVTYEDRTTSVVRGAEVVQIASSSEGSLTSEREVGIVVAVPSGDIVAALVHALRTGEVTVVRSTFASPDGADPLEYEPGTAGSD